MGAKSIVNGANIKKNHKKVLIHMYLYIVTITGASFQFFFVRINIEQATIYYLFDIFDIINIIEV